MAENIPNLVKYINIQIQEAEKTPHGINPKKPMPNHILIKLSKTKNNEKNLKSNKKASPISTPLCWVTQHLTVNSLLSTSDLAFSAPDLLPSPLLSCPFLAWHLPRLPAASGASVLKSSSSSFFFFPMAHQHGQAFFLLAKFFLQTFCPSQQSLTHSSTAITSFSQEPFLTPLSPPLVSCI